VKLAIGNYPPPSKVYISDSVLTLLAEASNSFSSSVPVVSTDGRLLNVVHKTKLAGWILEKLANAPQSEWWAFAPLDSTDLELAEPSHSVELGELKHDTLIELLLKRGVSELYITSSGKLIGEVNASHLLDLSSWEIHSDAKVQDVQPRKLLTVEHANPLPQALQATVSHSANPVGVSQENSLVGLLWLEDFFECVRTLLAERRAQEISGLKAWSVSTFNYLYVYEDESLPKALKLVKKTRERRVVVRFERDGRLVGLLDVRDALREMSDYVSKLLYVQTVR